MKPRGRFRGRSFLLGTGDGVVAALAFAATVVLRRGVRLPGSIGTLPVENVSIDLPWLLLVALVAVGTLSLAATRDEPLPLVRERGGLLVSSLLAAVLLVVAFFVTGRTVPRTVLILYTPLLYVSLELWRSLAETLSPIGLRRVLVLGSGRDAERAADALRSGEIAGHTLLEWRRDLSAFSADRRGDASSPIPENTHDVVFASDRPEDRSLLVRFLEESTGKGFSLWLLPGLTDVLASRVVTRSLGDLPLSPVFARAVSLPARVFRRGVDVILGTPLLVVAAPLIFLTSAAVVVDSRGPAWIRQRRVGRGGESSASGRSGR